MSGYIETFESVDDSYLEHFGVLGMHWGVRKYQNKDGSYTSAGKKRYSESQKHDIAMTTHDPDKAYEYKDSLSDDELSQRVRRLQLERQLKDISKGKESEGALWTKQTVKNIGNTLITTAAMYGVSIIANKYLKNAQMLPGGKMIPIKKSD